MSNEQLAVLIQSGSGGYIPELWERVQNLYKHKAARYFHANRDLCARSGVSIEDLQQQCYFAFMRSVKEYKPESGLMFTAFIDYPFLHEMQIVTGIRTAAARRDPLNNCISLDMECDAEDGGSTIADFVPDPNALDFLELLDRESVCDLIRAEVNAIPEQLREVIESYYFKGNTLESIAESQGISIERARQKRNEGLKKLSRRSVIIALWRETRCTEHLRTLEKSEREYTWKKDFIHHRT